MIVKIIDSFDINLRNIIKRKRFIDNYKFSSEKFKNYSSQRYLDNHNKRIDEIGDDVKKDFLDGMSKKSIRQKYKLTTKKQLNDILEYYGIYYSKIRHERNRLKFLNDNGKYICEQFSLGRGKANIAREFGVCKNKISWVLKEYFNGSIKCR